MSSSVNLQGRTIVEGFLEFEFDYVSLLKQTPKRTSYHKIHIFGRVFLHEQPEKKNNVRCKRFGNL
jgi:hypothetical protein